MRLIWAISTSFFYAGLLAGVLVVYERIWPLFRFVIAAVCAKARTAFSGRHDSSNPLLRREQKSSLFGSFLFAVAGL